MTPMPLKSIDQITPPRTGNVIWKDITATDNVHTKTFFVSLPLNDPSLNDNLEIWIYRGHFLYPSGWCIRCPKMKIDIDALYADPNDEDAAGWEALDLVKERAMLIAGTILKNIDGKS